jgi:hypothetical protein
MTLLETIKAIEGVAKAQPSVRMVVPNDIFRLNATPSAQYGVFGWTQGQHEASLDSTLIRFRFTFFYVDRLTEDKGNEVEVQSTGVQTLDTVIRTLADMGIVADDYTFQTFNQRFLDECAGVFCSVRLTVPIGWTCPDEFDDNDTVPVL